MRRICVIPCGTKKVWDKEPSAGAVSAEKAYIGVFHRLCQAYTKKFFDEWVILSAKHGFLRPNDFVPGPYNVSFSMKKHPELITINQLKEQAVEKNLLDVDDIVLLGGKKFRPYIEQVFTNKTAFHYPLSDCKGIGFMQQKLKQAIDFGQEIQE
ncbi:DUF6884 domain-containing protein [Aeribacillus pallidus]|uniref:DUF6884 domain-containing protein n=1 Tax=Aeribacillus pallidus TaxID=33936 RepID=A0A223E6N8_9BACI|nr:DUF6884 domain-containing protein [Aeribacillus pallidus]ASS90937.1 hypothetical protein AP3564_12550 [Aeribacillus pallidus]